MSSPSLHQTISQQFQLEEYNINIKFNLSIIIISIFIQSEYSGFSKTSTVRVTPPISEPFVFYSAVNASSYVPKVTNAWPPSLTEDSFFNPTSVAPYYLNN